MWVSSLFTALLIPQACVWMHYTFSSYIGIQMMLFIATWSIWILVKPMMQIRCSANLWCLKIKLLFIAPGHREIKIECVATQLEIVEWDACVNYSAMDEGKLGCFFTLSIRCCFYLFVHLHVLQTRLCSPILLYNACAESTGRFTVDFLRRHVMKVSGSHMQSVLKKTTGV